MSGDILLIRSIPLNNGSLMWKFHTLMISFFKKIFSNIPGCSLNTLHTLTVRHCLHIGANEIVENDMEAE